MSISCGPELGENLSSSSDC